jgi:hypothetical protein
MVVLITNAEPKMVERFLDTNLSRKHLAWIGITHEETTICLEDSEYTLESCISHTGREYINIHSGDDYFTVYNGEYDTIIME